MTTDLYVASNTHIILSVGGNASNAHALAGQHVPLMREVERRAALLEPS